MNKRLEHLKTQLRELTEAVNAFHSEQVQIKVIEWLLPYLEYKNELEASKKIKDQSYHVDQAGDSLAKTVKPPGPTRIINQLLKTDYFSTPHTIAEITEFVSEYGNKKYYTNTLSGILLGFMQQGKLKREKNENDNFYLYEIAT